IAFIFQEDYRAESSISSAICDHGCLSCRARLREGDICTLRAAHRASFADNRALGSSRVLIKGSVAWKISDKRALVGNRSVTRAGKVIENYGAGVEQGGIIGKGSVISVGTFAERNKPAKTA